MMELKTLAQNVAKACNYALDYKVQNTTLVIFKELYRYN